jgi:hypothetical protein
METLIESPQVAFVSGSRLPASPPISFRRLILPVLCVTIGVSVGSATGLTLALVNASETSVAASSNSLPNSLAPSPRVAMNAAPEQTAQPALAVSSTPTTAATNSEVSFAVESRPAISTLATKDAARPTATPSKVEVAFNKTPDALKPAVFRLNGKTYHVAKMAFLTTAAKPQEPQPDAAQTTIPSSLNAAQWSLDAPASSDLYTEGVLTVSDYSSSTRTIETSDGKTFVLGTTVAAGNATSWDTYRSDVHYRCDQNGSCVLMRAGVVAPDARLI